MVVGVRELYFYNNTGLFLGSIIDSAAETLIIKEESIKIEMTKVMTLRIIIPPTILCFTCIR